MNHKNYENEQYKHHPSPSIDPSWIDEVFPQITFKEHFPRTRIGCAPSNTGCKEQLKGEVLTFLKMKRQLNKVQFILPLYTPVTDLYIYIIVLKCNIGQ